VNTAIPPLADGSSNPSVFNVARNARALGYTAVVDDAALEPVSAHFMAIARRENFPIGTPLQYDAFHPIHQVPGGMISNFRFQLKQLGQEDKLKQVLEEVARVRSEFGYPIMVTPYSQFVGVQAAINVILGKRYQEVSDEIIQYALGHWGDEESSSIDPDVRDKILGRARAKELAQWKSPKISLKEFRQRFGAPEVSDDDLLLRYFAGDDYVRAMRAGDQPKEYVSTSTPLVAFLKELTQRKNARHIYIKRGNLTVRLEKGK
jgi:oxaloacetate decarboxylase alpha subunit